MDFPSRIAAAEAPDPRCSEINDVLSAGYHTGVERIDSTSVNEGRTERREQKRTCWRNSAASLRTNK